MGKPKKGKKGRQEDDDWEDGVATEIKGLSLDDKPEEETNGQLNEPKKPKAKKKDKKKKAAELMSDDDEEEEVVGDNREETDGSVKAPRVKAKGMSAFQMLAMDSDDDQESLGSSEEEPSPKPVPKKDKKNKQASFDDDQDTMDSTTTPEPTQNKPKGKKKGKDKKGEEDIDALLAEIESSAPGAKGKKKSKGKTSVEEEQGEEEKTDGTANQGAAAVTVKEFEAKDVSEMTQDEIAAWLDDGQYEEDDRKKKKKKKGKKQQQTAKEVDAAAADKDDEEEEEMEGEEEDEGGDGVKTAAQKKKEKKERQKQQKIADKAKQKKGGKKAEPENTEQEAVTAESREKSSNIDASNDSNNDAAKPTEPEITEALEDKEGDEGEGDKKKKKKDRKKKGKKEEEEEEKKKKPSKMAKAILELQKKQKEEQEQFEREEAEKERIIEEKRREKEEQERREKEKKEREKQKKKEKIERQKAEGKYETPKQKADRIRAEQMLEALKAQGVSVPMPGEAPKKKVVYERKKKRRPDQDQKSSDTASPTTTPLQSPTEEVDAEIKMEDKPRTPEGDQKLPAEEKQEEVQESWEDVKEEWDAESEEEDTKETESVSQEAGRKEGSPDAAEQKDESEEESDEEEEDEDEEEESSSEEESDNEDLTPAEKAGNRIQKRKEAADKKRSTDVLRAPVVCVLGHVDTGKTKILDKLRRTHVQDDEAGGITQQIGATNVPVEAIKEQTKMCKEFAKQELKLPGLLIIDTPGHESFSNLRTRGSSLCDIAILVIDIMHGLEPQTIESINLLKKRKTPFIVALNKIDRLFQWQSNPHNDIANTLKKQKVNTRQEFDERLAVTVVQLAEQSLNACLFNENKNPREYISLVPTSAHSGDGMGNLIALICELTQTMLAKRVSYTEHLQATVMEVKAIQGLGTTIDVILVNGKINEGDTIIIAGQEGPIVTQVRALLMPQPMKELRVKNAYTKHKEVLAAQGCKIIAKDLEKALAGLPLYVASKQDEIEYYKEEISEALEDILGSIKLQERGVFVQASTLGSLEALLEFLRTSKIPYAGINIGPVHKRDIMKASVMLEHDTQLAVILAFDVKVEREAQEMADSLGVTIFTAEIIYHLFDQFMAHREKYKKQKQEELKHIAVFPCKLRVLPQYIFNSRDPIVCGVIVEAGFIKNGTPIVVPSKEFCDLGRITSLEINHKQVDKGTKGQEVCIKIEPLPSDTPKLYGRHFDHTDMLVSKISRESIDAVKNYFREEMGKNDWQLIMELKKTFEII